MSALIETAEILDPPGAESAPVDLKAEWLEHLDKATCSSSGLAQLKVPPREPILGEWFKEADLGFIFGARGLGKTWLAMHIGRQCAEGGSVADWKVHQPRRVLYVDGEMALDSIRERDAGLSTTPVDGMFYLQHEALFHLTGKVLNLTNPVVQAAILEDCLRKKFEVLILDNLSCLFTGIKKKRRGRLGTGFAVAVGIAAQSDCGHHHRPCRAQWLHARHVAPGRRGTLDHPTGGSQR
jgi:hypothetical protein